MKRNNGVTLTALVITVIILLILAAVVLSMLNNEKDLIANANLAGKKYNDASEEEASVLSTLLALGNSGSGDMSQEDLLKIIQDLVTRVEALENQDGSNGGVASILEAYPVGAIYISTSETNPGDLFGGIWQAYAQGRTLVGVGTGEDTRGEQLAFAVNQTGGEYNHLLTTDEMPSHKHTLTSATGTSTTTASDIVMKDNTGAVKTSLSPVIGIDPKKYGSISATARTVLTAATTSSGETSSAGGSTAHNNIQPYIACYMWQRVS